MLRATISQIPRQASLQLLRQLLRQLSCGSLLMCGSVLSLSLAAPAWAADTVGAAPDTAGSQVVGQVNFVLGKPLLVHRDGSREAVRVGTDIRVGDSIQTQSNAQAHIRFVDNAMVSVRPFSTLEIQRYDYRAEAPAASAVKFNLVEGVTRAISGDAAKSARQNFRLNTPVAAIGVRGTDFVVRADAREARATVNEGAIVMAPFSSTCLVAALGPCADNGLELAGGGRQMALVLADVAEPILIPASGNGTTETLLAGPVAIAQTQTSAEPEGDSGNDLYTESVSSRVVSRKLASTASRPTLKPGFTPDTALTVESLRDAQLVWGRWSERKSSRELLSFSYDVARAGREVTVGNDDYALYRLENGSQQIKPGLGVVAFGLKQAQAYFTGTGDTESLMDVRGGKLALDFNAGQFSTSLELNHAATGALNLTDQGRLYGGGYFHSRNPDQVVAGAVSLDGSEAGYFFEKTLQNGLIEGITLWGSKP